MSDIVERLEHMEKHIGDEYGAEVAHNAKLEITRLRTELAEVRAEIERLRPVFRTPTDEERAAMQQLADSPHYQFFMQAYCSMVDALNTVGDTLRQQLAVAREGLEEIAKQKLADEMDEHQADGADFDFGYECCVKDARDTLAKLDQMGPTGSA